MVSLAPLEKSLRDAGENQMVRHEAAEAIGAISEESATPVSCRETVRASSYELLVDVTV